MSDILSGLLGGGRRGSGIAGNLSGGIKLAAVALLAHELMKHARQDRQQAQGAQDPQSAQETTGGLGGLLGGLTGGAGLGGLLGGLGGLLGQLRSHGLDRQVDSWISQDPNHPVSPQHLESIFDRNDVDRVAQQAGTDRDSLMQEVSRILPGLVDRLTPQGQLPQGEHELGGGGLGGLLQGLLGSEADTGSARDSLHGGAGNAPEAGTGAMGGAAAGHDGPGGSAARNPGAGTGGDAGMPRLDQGTTSGGTTPASGQGGPPQPRGTGPERQS
ncbi:MAG: YidB family protein [Acetobacteraceae bacterium]|nr:YidB family protein [Acetobacteraceae bacterium]